jgi:hypothetical protein
VKKEKRERERKKAIPSVIGYSNNTEKSQGRIKSRLRMGCLLDREAGQQEEGHPLARVPKMGMSKYNMEIRKT